MKFSPEFLQRIRDSIRIEDLVASYVPLTKKGNRAWACCPFHQEKTPSFSVSPDKGMYYCFGCHATGDIFTFVEKMENLSFPETVARLAEAAHIELPEEEVSDEDRRRQAELDALYHAAGLASDYFYNCLTKTRMGAEGLSYFQKRKLSMETIEAFHLGFAPPAWDRLFRDFTEKKQIPPKVLQGAGLVGNKNGRYYDMFRNRCMFPILNLRGRPVAFGGRVMDDSKPKYLNSPETPIFNKRRLLFALYQALPEIRRKRQVIMVEGYMDAISLHAHGVTNVVASLGTAFTEEQARLLRRYADEVVFSYDMDAAGQTATRRALEIAGAVRLKLRVARVGEGKDPDEFVNARGKEAYLEAVRQAQPAVDYLFSSLMQQNDASSLEGQHAILEAMFPVLAARNDSIFINAFIRKMANAMRMDEGVIRAEAARYVKREKVPVYISPREEREDLPSQESFRQTRLEEGFLKYCVQRGVYPDRWEAMKEFTYTEGFCRRLYGVLKALEEAGVPLSEKAVQQALSPEDTEAWAALLMREEYVASDPWEEYVRPLVMGSLQKEYRAHTEAANRLADTDPAGWKEEMLACIRLNQKIRDLQNRKSDGRPV